MLILDRVGAVLEEIVKWRGRGIWIEEYFGSFLFYIGFFGLFFISSSGSLLAISYDPWVQREEWRSYTYPCDNLLLESKKVNA